MHSPGDKVTERSTGFNIEPGVHAQYVREPHLPFNFLGHQAFEVHCEYKILSDDGLNNKLGTGNLI